MSRHSHPLPQVFDGLGDLLMPAVTPQSTGGSTAGSTAGSMGTPVAAGGIASTPPPTKTIGGDLDSSLANLIGGRLQLFLSGAQPFLFVMHTYIVNLFNVYFVLLSFFCSDLGVKKK